MSTYPFWVCSGLSKFRTHPLIPHHNPSGSMFRLKWFNKYASVHYLCASFHGFCHPSIFSHTHGVFSYRYKIHFLKLPTICFNQLCTSWWAFASIVITFHPVIHGRFPRKLASWTSITPSLLASDLFESLIFKITLSFLVSSMLVRLRFLGIKFSNECLFFSPRFVQPSIQLSFSF